MTEPPTLTALEEMDVLIRDAELEVETCTARVTDAVYALARLRETQARMVELYNRHAAGPLTP